MADLANSFLNAVFESLNRLGLQPKFFRRSIFVKKAGVCFVWNRNRLDLPGTPIFCEHGWLPRWGYQISHKGINANSHHAPFLWKGEDLSSFQERELRVFLEKTRKEANSKSFEFNGGLRNSNDGFLLAPLQLEHDSNIRFHAPGHLRNMQAFVDLVSINNPPFPVIFKQHPADDHPKRQKHLSLQMKRSQDFLFSHKQGKIYDLLTLEKCLGIITINSNAIHDALLFEKPGIVLGNNIWPKNGVGPFFPGLPTVWNDFFQFFQDPKVQACRRSYSHFLMKIGWSLEDVKNPGKISAFLNDISERGTPRQTRTIFKKDHFEY